MKRRQGSAASAAGMAALFLVGSSSAAGSRMGIESAAALRKVRSGERSSALASPPARGAFRLWVAGGVGAIVPIPAGGGGGIAFAFDWPNRASAGMFGHCAGASGGQTPKGASDSTSSPRRVAILCDVGLTGGFRGTTRLVSPAVEIGVGWGFLGLIDETRNGGRYSGSGAVMVAQAGAHIGERYQVMLRADVPLFRAKLEHRATGDVHGVSIFGELGIRIF